MKPICGGNWTNTSNVAPRRGAWIETDRPL